MLYRLSAAVTVLLLSVTSLAMGIELPMSRASRALPIVGILGSVVAIVLITRRLGRRRHPGVGGPEASARAAIASAQERIEAVRASRSAALHRRRRSERVEQAQLAAQEAAKDDERLAPQQIKTAAEALFRLVHLAWDERDSGRLAELLGAALLAERQRALDANDAAAEHHRSHVLGEVHVELVGLTVDPAGAHTAVVLIEAEMDIGIDNRNGRRVFTATDSPSARRLCQYWTLVMHDGRFHVHAIEDRAEGEHHLSEPLVAHAVA